MGKSIASMLGWRSKCVDEDWEDQTELLRSLDVEPGTMLCHEKFSLFDSMQAVEILDPRMDPRYRHYDDETPSTAFSKTVEGNDFSVMKFLQCGETAFYTGESIGHSLFTCSYVHSHALAALRGSNQTMFAFAASVLRCCNHALSLVRRADMFEEEDFIPHIFGFDLSAELPSDDIAIALLDLAKMEFVSSGNEEAASLIDMRIALLKLLNRLDSSEVEGAALITTARAEIKNFSDTVQAYGKLRTVDPLMVVDTKTPNPKLGFFPSLSKRLILNAPPRPVLLRSEEESFSWFSKFSENLTILSDYFHKKEVTLDELSYFLDQFSEIRNPGIIIRSFMVTMLGTFDAFLYEKPIKSYIDGSLCGFSPVVAWNEAYCLLDLKSKNTDVAMKTPYAYTIERAGYPVVRVLKIHCVNRSRQLQYFQACLPDWGLLQHDAGVVDQTWSIMWQNNSISTESSYDHATFAWFTEKALQLICQQLLHSFDSQLFVQCEYAPMYWAWNLVLQLRLHLIYSAQRACFSAQSSAYMHAEAELRTDPDSEPVFPKPFNVAICKTDVLLVETQRNMCLGMHKCLEFLRRKGLYQIEEFELCSAETRFTHRVETFTNVIVPGGPLTYDKFREQVLGAAQDNDKALAAEALDAFKLAKKLIELCLQEKDSPLYDFQRERFQALARVSVSNSVFLMSLPKKLANLEKPAVTFDFSVHSCFPILALVNK